MVIGIILVGTGHIAEEHARAIKRVKGAKLVGVFSKDKARAGDFAKKHNTNGYWDINEALKNPEVNVLDIANQNYLHGDFALLGINAGKHLIIEKPIDISVAKARKVIEVLLTKYEDEGIEEMENSEILKVSPINKLGRPLEIMKLFGGVAGYKMMIKEIEGRLYK